MTELKYKLGKGGYNIVETLIGLGFLLFLWIIHMINESRFNNRVSQNGIDWTKMNYDSAMGKSQSDIKKDYINGKYDKVK